jgi:hypothetical protein
LTLIDMFAWKLPAWVESTLGASRIAVPSGRHRPCAKTWRGAQPPDMPTTELGGEGEPEPSKPTALNHHGGPVAAATASTRATPAPITVSREIAIAKIMGCCIECEIRIA